MEVFVTVLVEDLYKEDDAKIALTAFFTMVALDNNGKPTHVPSLATTSSEEQTLFEEGRQRYLTYREKEGVEE